MNLPPLQATPTTPAPPRTWTIIGHTDATSSDLERIETARVKELETVDKSDAHVVMELRREAYSKPVTALRHLAIAAIAPVATLAIGAVGAAMAVGGQPLMGALFGVGALAEGALLSLISKSGIKGLRNMRYPNAEPAWSGTRRYYMEDARSTAAIASPRLAESKSTAAPTGTSLGRFLTQTMRSYPAQRFAFIYSGHGRAMHSVGGTDFREIGKATEIAHANTGRRLDVVVLDSCLVGNFETLLPMADHVRYAVVSQEPLYTSVIDWSGIIGDVHGAPPSAHGFFHAALERAHNSASHQTLSAVRMSQMPALRASVEQLGAAIQKRAAAGHRKAIRAAFDRSVKVRDMGPISRNYENKLDMGQLLKNLHETVPDPELCEAAGRARTAYARAVVDHSKGANFQDTTGLSIQGPRLLHQNGAYARKSGLPEWSKALGEMRPWPVRMVSCAFDGIKRLVA